VIGWLGLWCHGDGDLLSMTDAAFHFACLGIDASDAGMHQYLAAPMPSFAGTRGRAERLDRMLAIDLLRQKGGSSAEASLREFATRNGAPAVLRERALSAIAQLHGAASPRPRHRLDPAKLPLPPQYDACVVIDHSRLPGLDWLPAFDRERGMRRIARTLLAEDGQLSPALCSDAQRLADMNSELPFGLVLRYGNARIDQSCLLITAGNTASLPVAVTFAAAGEFEAGGWQQARLPTDLVEFLQLEQGSLQVSEQALLARSDGRSDEPQPEVAKELLRDRGAAIHAVIPQQSRLWTGLAFLQLPPAEAAELRVTIGDVVKIELEVQARDAGVAGEWLAKGRQLLARAVKELQQPTGFAASLKDSRALRLLIDTLGGVQLAVHGDKAHASFAFKDCDRVVAMQLIEALMP
jgi:hypothetical protein